MGSFAVKGPKVFFSELSKSGRRSVFQVYQKHNRNLIGEDESPELVMALRRRLSLVQREPGGRRGAGVGAGGSLFNSPVSSPESNTSPQCRFEALASSRPESFEGSLPTAVLGKSVVSHFARNVDGKLEILDHLTQMNLPSPST